MSQITINNIDFTLNYEGYLWMSNEKEPRVYPQPTTIDAALLHSNNPFVVEGYLYNKERGVSLSIKSPQGVPCVHRFEVHKADFEHEDSVTHVAYLAHRMGSRRLHFLRFWRPEEDKACLGMHVLRVEKLVFVGFKK